jgi:hypothetical protein
VGAVRKRPSAVPKGRPAELVNDAWGRCERAPQQYRRDVLSALARAFAFAYVEGDSDRSESLSVLFSVADGIGVPAEVALYAFRDGVEQFVGELADIESRRASFHESVGAMIEARYGNATVLA